MIWKGLLSRKKCKKESEPKSKRNSLADRSPIEEAKLELPPGNDVATFLANLEKSDTLQKADTLFSEYHIDALLNARSRSLLYFLTRFLKPNYILEIGTYKLGSGEIMTRALKLNGKGTLITTDPYGPQRVPDILESWPEGLKRHLDYWPLSSMDCFIRLKRRNIFCEFIFIDGDHSYEYALYDLQMAARHASPGGIVILDNVEQTGVYWAVKAFLSTNPDWQELGCSIVNHDIKNPYSTMRPSFPESSFLILQAPQEILISSLPRSFESSHLSEIGLSGFELKLSGEQEDGLVNAMVFFRNFWHSTFEGENRQEMKIFNFSLKAGQTDCKIEFPEPFLSELPKEKTYRTHEIILSWLPNKGAKPLKLLKAPAPLIIK